MLVLERIDVEFIVENMAVEEALEAMIVDDIMSDKFEVGFVNAEAIVGEELVVGVAEVGVAEVIDVTPKQYFVFHI